MALARLGNLPSSSKQLLLGAVLAAAFLQYYFIDVHLQIMAQPTLTVFVPAKHAGS